MLIYKSLKLFFIIAIYFVSAVLNYANSACYIDSYKQITVPLSSFQTNNTISSDLAYPNIILSSNHSENRTDLNCTDSPGIIKANISLSNSFGLYGDIDNKGIAKTNIDGIGVSFEWYKNGSSGDPEWNNIKTIVLNGSNYFFFYNASGVKQDNNTGLNNISSNFKFNLVKYGASPDNFVLNGSDMPCLNIALGLRSSSVDSLSMCFSGSISFNSGTCDIENTIIQLGSISKYELDLNGYSEWIDSNINLVNCSEFYSLFGTSNIAEIKIIPSNSGDYENGMFNINEGVDSASGIALQVRDSSNNNILNFNDSLTMNKVLSQSTLTNIIIPLQTRYVKNDVISPGNVDASMTVIIEYK